MFNEDLINQGHKLLVCKGITQFAKGSRQTAIMPLMVVGFETLFIDNMGNTVPEVSNSATFTPNQLTKIRSLSRGKLFNIRRIRVVGPDGIERTLTSPVEVIIN